MGRTYREGRTTQRFDDEFFIDGDEHWRWVAKAGLTRERADPGYDAWAQERRPMADARCLPYETRLGERQQG